MTTPTLSADQLHILQHSLGLDRYGQGNPYRNHYVAGGDSLHRCRLLAVKGLMTERDSSAITGGDPVFHVTPEGRQAVEEQSPQPPKLTRGQRMYRYWLRISDACGDSSFKDFLTKPEFKESRERALV